MIRLVAPRAMRPLAAGLLVAALSAAPAAPASLADLEKAEAAVLAIWEELPLTFPTAVFVESSDGSYGVYTPREGATFAPGEKLVVHAEPVGYMWDQDPDGRYSFGFDVDFLVTTPEGRVLAGQQNFQRLVFKSFERNREFVLTLTLKLTGFPAGDFVLDYVMRDIASDKSGTISLPFSIAE